MDRPGIFVISLDFELHWGRFESVPVSTNAFQYYANTRKIIPEKLRLFEKEKIHATWAAVGMLFLENIDDWRSHLPNEIPSYENNIVSSYQWLSARQYQQSLEKILFAPDLVRKIIDTEGQELGTHTYSHYYCVEPGQTPNQFRADLLMAKNMAERFGISLQSLVFPRNQYNESYLEVCSEMGIANIRTNPDVWYWHPVTKSTPAQRAARFADTYFRVPPAKAIAKQHLLKEPAAVFGQPASRIYKAWKPSLKEMNRLKLRRILNEMTDAALQGKYYHLWWHPHNFGFHPMECLSELRIIIKHFQALQNQYGFCSMNMIETKQWAQEHLQLTSA